MSAYNKFITNNFMTDKGILFLPLKQYEDKMIGTKNNLTLKELNEVHTEGFVKQNDGKIYNMIADNETTHLELRLKYTDNIVCLDIDGLNENGDVTLEQFLEKCPEVFKNFPYTLSRKKKLPHFYFKLDGIDIQSLKGTYVDCFNNMKADILFNHCWEKRDAEMFNYNDKEGLPFIDYEDIKHLIKPDTFKVKEPKEPKEYNTNNKKDENILDLIDVKYWDEYESWKRLVWAMKNEGYSEETARKYSMKSSKYDDNGFTHFWEKPPIINDLTQGTINYYAKLSDKDKYYDIVTNYTDTTDNESISTLGTSDNEEQNLFISTDVLRSGASEIAERILPSIKGKLKYCKKKWCIYNEKTHLWDTDGTPAYMIIKLIKKYIKVSINVISSKLKMTDNDDESKLLTDNMKFYLNQLGAVDKPSFTSQITNHLKDILLDNDFYNKLDNHPYYLAFKNGLYDMRTKTLLSGGLKQEHYLTRTIDFDYEPSSDEHKDFVKDVLRKICNNNEEHLNYYLSVFGFSLLGDPEKEKSCYFLVGQGGNNGKTLILDAMREVMPCYTSKIDRQTFEEGYTKAHKHLIGVKGMRIVYVEELRKGKKVDECRLKEVADGKTIKNEVMFGTDEEIDILFKLFFLSNHTPNFNPDNGVQNRYNQLQFNSQFTKEEEDPNRLKFKRDEKMGDKLKNEYKYALMDLLLEKAYEYTISGLPNVPLEFQEATKETINANNEFEMWFEESCEIGEDLRCGKEELIQCHPKIPFRELTDIMKGMGYKYERKKRKNNIAGIFEGFEIKTECLINL